MLFDNISLITLADGWGDSHPPTALKIFPQQPRHSLRMLNRLPFSLIAETNLYKIRAAIKDKLESALTAGEIKEMEQTFRQSLVLNAMGELDKWNREKAFQEQAAKQGRDLDLQTIEMLELLEQKAADDYNEAKLDFERAEHNFTRLYQKVNSLDSHVYKCDLTHQSC